jgi:FtsZ-interacting cell division protein ZipA
MSIAYILVVAVLGYTVYLIFEDSVKDRKTNSADEVETDNCCDDHKHEETKQTTKTVERSHNATGTSSSGAVTLKQGDNYVPTSTPGQQVKTVTTTTTKYVTEEHTCPDCGHTTSSKDKVEEVVEVEEVREVEQASSSKDSSNEETAEQTASDTVKSTCPYCDLVLDVPAGDSVVCPRCGGTVTAD